MTQGLAERPVPSDLNSIGGTLGIAKGGTGETAKTPAFDALAPATTKGDIVVYNGTDNIRLPVGADNDVLTADAVEANGLKWAPAPGGPGGADTQVQFNDGGVLAGDPGFIYDKTTKRVGIGTTVPFYHLTVSDATGTNGPTFGLKRDDSAVFSGDRIGRVAMLGGESDPNSVVGSIVVDAEADWTTTSSPTRIEFRTTAIGSTVDVERVRIDSAGNVGIGMTAPSQVLEVKGNILAKDSTSLFIADRAAGTNFSGLQLFTGGVVRWTIGSRNDSTENLHFFDEGSGNTRLFLDRTSGNIGIGTTSPDELTHFAKAVDGISVGLLLENSQANSAASINETAELRFAFGGINDVARIVAGKESDYTTVANEDSFLAFNVDQDGVSEEQVRIASGGKVGIRTSDPQYMLDMGTDANTFVSIDGLFGHIIQHNNASAEFWTLATRDNGNFSIANTTSNPRPSGGVIASSNDKITILPDGGVGIGGTPAANAILDISSTTKAFLPPRMTTTQRDAIASPTGGLVIYNSTTTLLNFHNGTSWGAV